MSHPSGASSGARVRRSKRNKVAVAAIENRGAKAGLLIFRRWTRSRRRRWQREERKRESFIGAQISPKGFAFFVFAKHQQVALLNALSRKCRQPRRDERATETTTPVFAVYRQMVNQAATAIVPAQDGTNHSTAVERHEARARIAIQEAANAVEGIGFAQADACRVLPKRERGRVVLSSERDNVSVVSRGNQPS